MAKNQQLLEALQNLTLDSFETYEQALLDLMQADLSEAENFRQKVVEHYQALGLKEDFIQDQAHQDEFLHHAGFGDGHQANNFRALQRVAAEKYILLQLQSLPLEAISNIAQATDLLPTLVTHIGGLASAYHLYGEGEDRSILMDSSLCRIQEQAKALEALKRPRDEVEESSPSVDNYERNLVYLKKIASHQVPEVQEILTKLITEINVSNNCPEATSLLNEVLTATIELFTKDEGCIEDKVESYQKVAEQMKGYPAPYLSKVSDLMFALGVAVLIAGIVLIPFAPIAAAAVTVGVGAALTLFGTFYHPKPTGLAGAMSEVASKVGEMDVVEVRARPSFF
ncbi:hypothetical protein [Legionella impletisoli]|uniref:Uncharacterized protein n=1 Tax=Legionella impletisoli TaxID=343510 RepID=A0A917NAI3_9GAMM|nr:hypothetical protein [Legionella impletisoli]GGI81735.1 hypothetical protein GCM10007966_07820 [Legionella impletisoli]